MVSYGPPPEYPPPQHLPVPHPPTYQPGLPPATSYPASAPPVPPFSGVPYSGVAYSGPPYQPGRSGAAPRSAGAAVALEIVLGLFGVFGVGNIYAGKVGQGIALMVSFWVLFWVNVLLWFFVIGIVTGPLTYIAYLVIGPVTAARAVESHNRRALGY